MFPNDSSLEMSHEEELISKHEAELMRERQLYADLVSKIIDETGVEIGAGGITAIEAVRKLRQERDLAQGAMRAQDENLRRQLTALGLAKRFPSITHLADDMGAALLAAESWQRKTFAALAEIAEMVNLRTGSSLVDDTPKAVRELFNRIKP